MIRTLVTLVALIPLTVHSVHAQESKMSPEMAAGMKRWEEARTPGPMHEKLERFVGQWTSEMAMTMGPSGPAKKERGTMTCRWLLPGRFLVCEAEGTMMGLPVESYSVFGYDNMKKTYVGAHVDSMNTHLLHYHGWMTRDDRALVMWGPMDEPITSEHDKVVKYVWRFVSQDEMVLEVHDMPIGLENTKVVEITYRRVKER